MSFRGKAKSYLPLTHVQPEKVARERVGFAIKSLWTVTIIQP